MQISCFVGFVFLKPFKFFTYVIKLAFATCVPEGEVDAIGMALALDLETIGRLAYSKRKTLAVKLLIYLTWHFHLSSIPHSAGIALSQSTLSLESTVPLSDRRVPFEKTVALEIRVPLKSMVPS